MLLNIKKERFIPLRKTDLIHACLNDGNMSPEEANDFKALCNILVGTLHYEYHQILETLKDSYAPFSPNSDTKVIRAESENSLEEKQRAFAETFRLVLSAANFEKVTEKDLQDALNEESLFKVRLAVEFEDFAEVVFYRRGEHQKTEVLTKFWGLKEQEVNFTNYDKVAVYIKFKDAAYFESINKQAVNFEPGSTVIKLFQNVPKADLEMLFPNSEVKMRTIDKVIIGGSAIVGGGIMLATKLGASLIILVALFSYWLGVSDEQVVISHQQLLALAAGFGVLGGFIFKEWSKFKNRKLRFMKALADNLYFKNLDNNSGVFHHLIDSAEEEECKESILAYYFLLNSDFAMSQQQLDKKIEQWFESQFGCQIDFEIDDAIRKLLRFGMIKKVGEEYSALPVRDAQALLDKNWDNIFSFSQ